MPASTQRRSRRPNWPRWVYQTFNARGLRLLEAAYTNLKESSGLERAPWISAEDLAASIYAQLQSAGRTEFFQTAGAPSRVA